MRTRMTQWNISVCLCDHSEWFCTSIGVCQLSCTTDSMQMSFKSLVENYITNTSTSRSAIITRCQSRCSVNKPASYIKCRMLHAFYHPFQISIKTMAPAPNDPVSAITLTPALCGHCPNPASITCSGCTNMQHCSERRQQSDAAQYNTLCGTFQNF
jgi:hypothetical protein